MSRPPSPIDLKEYIEEYLKYKDKKGQSAETEVIRELTEIVEELKDEFEGD